MARKANLLRERTQMYWSQNGSGRCHYLLEIWIVNWPKVRDVVFVAGWPVVNSETDMPTSSKIDGSTSIKCQKVHFTTK